MRVVVTGATGNVGTSVLEALITDPAVRSISGIARRLPILAKPKTHFIRADVSRDDLVPLFEGADVVVHLAWLLQPARNLKELWTVNVEGSRRVFEAVAKASVPSLVHASSVGAYSPRPDDRRVDESWPTTGMPKSYYSRQKAEVERMLDDFERRNPDVRVVRMRPCLIFKRTAASEIKRYFLGPLIPRFLFQRRLLWLVPRVEGLRFQVMHSLDAGEAYRLAVTRDVRGAFNIAADPVVDSLRLAELLEARSVAVSRGVLRAATSASFHLHLHRTDPGWIDLATTAPLLDTSRALRELEFSPRYGSTRALMELLDGLHRGSGLDTPPLSPRPAPRQLSPVR